MQPPRQPLTKQAAVLQVLSFAMLIVMLTFVGTTMMRPTGQGGMDFQTVIVVCGLPIVLSAFLTVRRLLPNAETRPAVFQTTMLMCLAVAEVGTLLAFVFHMSDGTPIWPLAAGSLAVILGLILPRVLLYWQNQETKS